MHRRRRTITIDGRPCAFADGETILAVARRHGIDIPTLCHLKGATPTGACRICMVEVEKARSLQAACALPAADGMVVQTESPKVVRSRKMVLELLLSSGRHDCVTCAGAGECRLQELAMRYGVAGRKFPPTPPRYAAETRTPSSCATSPSASSAAAACRPATTSRSTTRSTSATAASKGKIVAGEDVPLPRRRSASSAASACRPARPTRWSSRGPTSRSGPGRGSGCAPPAATAAWAASSGCTSRTTGSSRSPASRRPARTTAASASRAASATTSSATRTGSRRR